jgi:PAS domain S-box-containing protein
MSAGWPVASGGPDSSAARSDPDTSRMPRTPARPPAGTTARPAEVRPAEPGIEIHDSGAVLDPWVGRIAATDGMFVTDDRQRIVAWSSAAQRMLGFSADEAVGKTCYQVVMGREPDGHPVCGRNCSVTRNARRGRGTASYEVVAQARDGGAKCLSNSVLVVEGPDGTFHVIHLLKEAASPAPMVRRQRVAVPDVADEPMVETLTRRELEVLRHFAGGSTIDEIAEVLSISVFTARNHIASVGRKLGARSRLEIVLLGMRRGLV